MITRERIVPLAILLLVLVVIGIIAVFGGWGGFLPSPAGPVAPSLPVSVEADSVDGLNDDRLISVQGKLEFDRPAVDDELGVSDPGAVVLLRHVEMYQWQETCIADSCTQALGWTSELLDAAQFNEQLGHANPGQFPFASTSFIAEGIRLGAFVPSLDLITAEVPMLPKSVQLLELPANLAASFSEIDGGIFAGNDALHPVVGDLRITYRMVSTGTVTLVGKQAGNRLIAVPAE